MFVPASYLWTQADGARVVMGLQNPPPIRLPGDLPPGAMKGKATTACTECHEARIILQQRLSKATWTKEVDKMIKWGAVVDPSDRDGFIEYLSANFPIDRPPYEAGKTSAQKKKK